MMSTKSRITVISLTVSMIFFMTENVQSMGLCERELKDFGYNGRLDHDTQYFEILNLKPIPWIPKYRVFMDYIDDKVFSTDSDLVLIHCTNVETLFDEGFTGALPIDRKIPDNVPSKKIKLNNDPQDTLATKSTTNKELVGEYSEFVDSEPYSKLKEKKDLFIFDLVYEFALKNKIKTTAEGIPCKEALKEEGYTGNFVNDILSLVKKTGKTPSGQEPATDVEDKSFVGRYNRFMQYAKFYVLLTDNNIMDVYCDLLAPLKNEGFTGKLDEDLKYAETFKDKPDHKLKEEVKIYKGYLERVNKKAYEDADIKYPDSFLAQLGLVKLGKILY